MSSVLQARGKEVFMNTYDDNHPLAKVENDVNVMINAAVFFNNCLDAWMFLKLMFSSTNKTTINLQNLWKFIP